MNRIQLFFNNIFCANNEEKIICPNCKLLQHKPIGYDYQICTKCKKYIYDYR